MRKYIIPIAIIIVVVIIAAVYFLQKGQQEIPSTYECSLDSDCKLIYSNCDCEATSINDPRTSLESNAICKWNICHGTNVTAVCSDNKCIRSDK